MNWRRLRFTLNILGTLIGFFQLAKLWEISLCLFVVFFSSKKKIRERRILRKKKLISFSILKIKEISFWKKFPFILDFAKKKKLISLFTVIFRKSQNKRRNSTEFLQNLCENIRKISRNRRKNGKYFSVFYSMRFKRYKRTSDEQQSKKCWTTNNNSNRNVIWQVYF